MEVNLCYPKWMESYFIGIDKIAICWGVKIPKEESRKSIIVLFLVNWANLITV